jgi:transposase
MKQKKRYTSEEKSIILREHLENSVPISTLAEKYNLRPNVLYSWRKHLFETAPQSLERKTKRVEKAQSRQEQRIVELESLLARRENLITELVEENIELKKKSNGVFLTRNGLNPTRGTK